MATLAQLAPRIFRLANRRYGKPYMTVVRPVDDWNLPNDFAYDPDVDAVRNSNGTVLPNPEDYWTSDVVYIVPTKADWRDDVAELFKVVAGGMLNEGTLELWIAQGDISKVRAAHSVLLDRRWYNVENQQEAPSGYPGTDGLWSRVRLRGRS